MLARQNDVKILQRFNVPGQAEIRVRPFMNLQECDLKKGFDDFETDKNRFTKDFTETFSNYRNLEKENSGIDRIHGPGLRWTFTGLIQAW